MRITVNLDDAVVELLDASADAHHESRAEYAGMLLASQLTSQNQIHDQYIHELKQREEVIKRLTGEVQDLRRLLDEARVDGAAVAAGDADRLRDDVIDLRARLQEQGAQLARVGDLERELHQARERERRLMDLIYQEKGEKKALLERLPPAEEPRRGVREWLFGSRRKDE
ncbi:MAG: hypothetical protein PHS18_04130 [Sphaerochaetaceae bacterium]|nr:hypothetical protein [Sphaerochaetaceae bacterium]MDD5076256.1 hypothetical protein [Sphaerochaetaceae bacterium]